MGSFQQITMGIICLAAAFWFGSFLQEQPAGQNPTAARLPDGTIDPNRAANPSDLIATTKGFLSSLFESQEQTKPVTVADLRQRSQATTGRDKQSNQNFPGELTGNLIGSTTAAQNRIQGSAENLPPTDGPISGPVSSMQVASRVAIVPDFSSLADEVNRGLSFNDRPADRPLPNPNAGQLLPVPNFSAVDAKANVNANQNANANAPSSQMDWEALRQRVADAENRLKNHRDQMTQPIPAIQQSVTQQTLEFQNRQQPRPRPQPLELANDDRSALRWRQQNRETFHQKQNRWDVFSSRPSNSPQTQRVENRSAITVPDDAGETSGQRTGAHRVAPALGSTSTTSPTRIVEVDREFVSQSFSPGSDRPADRSSARVRSLNDDRYTTADSGGRWSHRETSNELTNRAPLQNQLRPQYDPNPGSGPEFVSPPDYQQLEKPSSQSASAQSGRSPRSSEIVAAAQGAYGSFREYETQPGDTLQTISIKFYGTADYYFDLYLANRALLRNPASVPEGKIIKIPRFDGN